MIGACCAGSPRLAYRTVGGGGSSRIGVSPKVSGAVFVDEPTTSSPSVITTLRCLNRGSLAALSGATPTPGFPPGSRGVQSHVPVIGSSGAHPRARLRADSAEISAMASVRGNNRHQLPQLT